MSTIIYVSLSLSLIVAQWAIGGNGIAVYLGFKPLKDPAKEALSSDSLGITEPFRRHFNVPEIQPLFDNRKAKKSIFMMIADPRRRLHRRTAENHHQKKQGYPWSLNFIYGA
eukprot:TRINITY_DN45849_c1_g1_i1.p2 TRINITY_DN45849_c1_g1~~TRINITY_DN45849_c1_g1_i1.p2  ORF type:complete len:128 (+),score=4.74 TRINITY_DN45849_c1_g1_i1:49-384(+)